MSKSSKFKIALITVGLGTAACGLIALGIATVVAIKQPPDPQLLHSLFNTANHLFSAGMGALLLTIGSNLGDP